ncbi:hypothetical protein SDC9_112139 [bioreactor metagenome]|uniref:Uncharacterized protein n=1 Tax=bioreactor metagenome TaxID=1076179 RepID=A0A645BTW5_9ZZZZ|nr:hypothetical protein [Erysipelotrichaceae bacterium]
MSRDYRWGIEGTLNFPEEESYDAKRTEFYVSPDTIAKDVDDSLDETSSTARKFGETNAIMSAGFALTATILIPTPLALASSYLYILSAGTAVNTLAAGKAEVGIAIVKYISGEAKIGLDGQRLSDEEAEYRSDTAGVEIHHGVTLILVGAVNYFAALAALDAI